MQARVVPRPARGRTEERRRRAAFLNERESHWLSAILTASERGAPLLAFSLQVSLGFSSVVDKHLDRILFCLISCDTGISPHNLCHQ